MKPESFDEQLSRFDLMCEGDPTFDLSDNDIAALLAVRTEMRIMARSTLASQERIKELEAKLAAKWISVDERLPEDQQEVLIVVPSINLHTKAERQDVFHANFWEESKTMASCEEGDFEDGEYTHWQPLPDPPVQP